MIDQQTAQLLGIQPTTTKTPDTRSWPERLQDHIKNTGAAEYQPAMDEFRQNMADLHQRAAREIQDATHADRGRSLVASGHLAGLPAGLVATAQQAVTTEQAAIQLHDRLQAEADRYIQRHGLSHEAGRVYKELHCAESSFARAEASNAAVAACRALGAAAERIGQADADLASDAQKRQEAEHAYQQALAQLDQRAATARAVKREYGL